MAESKELNVIKQLSEHLRKELQPIPPDQIMPGLINGFAINEKDHIVGLNLVNAQILDISFLSGLKNLTHLNLAWNRITDISPIHGLTALKCLDLSGNRLTDLSPLHGLTGLTYLLLNSNQVSDLSPLHGLTHLTHLSLYNNRVTDTYPLLTLVNLERLDLTSNNISRLPNELANMGAKIKWGYEPSGKGIFLEDNSLEVPPVEIVRQGDVAIKNYFKEIQYKDVLLLQSKVLMVGSGAVGKTTLVRKLRDNKMKPDQEPTTHGIHIVPWDITCTFANGETHPVKIEFWDFGGQDILYTTHQFFLTKRSLYLFVWEARQEGQETAGFEYWLNIIKLLSAGSPVIVVMNKADIRAQFIDEASFRKKFPNIRAFIQVSCLTGKGITELTELIRSSLSEMPHLQDRLPKAWKEIRDDLKQQNKNYISLANYLAICQKHGLNAERAEFLSDYLHDLGAILHFRHGEPLLADTVILNPEWATSAVYKIMDTPAIIINKGRFHYDELKTYWDPRVFPKEKHPQLLRLMEKFELCYPVPGTDIHIVPELLPVGQPELELEKYRGPDSLRFDYHYEFMPRGILSRFITRLYYLIRGERFWKNGVELVLDNTFALVQSDPLNRKMTIAVTGADKSELLAIVCHHLEDIHRTLNMEKNEHYYEMIPCHCSTCRKTANPYLYRYEVLKRFTEKGIKYVRCQESAEEMAIGGLLKGFAPSPQNADLSELLPALIKTAVRLQCLAKTIKPDEDSRNSIIAQFLTASGYMFKENMNMRWGNSSSEDLDFLIETPDGNAVSVMEAFNLTGFNRNVIAGHFQKLFTYDANGLEANYIIVYVESADFGKLWRDYLSCLPEVGVKYKLQGAPVEEKTPYADIKLARTMHDRHNRETTVYHLFINMLHS